METDQGAGVFGIGAQYKDTQAAAGWWLAGFGTFVIFIGAVGLWAKRRDIVAAIARAKKQRKAAEISTREIEEAAEAYAREHEGVSAS
jgi:protein-S-isoprenylcysteine O-methyltransferase Ste14